MQWDITPALIGFTSFIKYLLTYPSAHYDIPPPHYPDTPAPPCTGLLSSRKLLPGPGSALPAHFLLTGSTPFPIQIIIKTYH
jgi:hypothetical protein